LDVATTIWSFNAIFTDKNIVSWTWNSLSIIANTDASCDTILKSWKWDTNWIYTINPTWNLPLKVYCDMITNWGWWTRIMDYKFDLNSTYTNFSDWWWWSWTFSNWFFWANSAVGWHHYKISNSTGSLDFNATKWFVKFSVKPNIYNTWNSYGTIDSTNTMATTIWICDLQNTTTSPLNGYYNPNRWMNFSKRFSTEDYVSSITNINLVNKKTNTFFICIQPNGRDWASGYTYTPAFSSFQFYVK
jgi:hypothetical protein